MLKFVAPLSFVFVVLIVIFAVHTAKEPNIPFNPADVAVNVVVDKEHPKHYLATVRCDPITFENGSIERADVVPGKEYGVEHLVLEVFCVGHNLDGPPEIKKTYGEGLTDHGERISLSRIDGVKLKDNDGHEVVIRSRLAQSSDI